MSSLRVFIPWGRGAENRTREPDVPAIALAPQIHLAEDQDEDERMMGSRRALAGAA